MGGGPRSNENPPHDVHVDAFRLARAPVTRAEYQLFLDATDHGPPEFWHEPGFGQPRMPAVGPSWDDATAYCHWLAEQLGSGSVIRLPTEAEWERAARGGRRVEYPWGDEPPQDRLPDYGRRWLDGPEPVDAYPSLHPWGFLGLCENVHEWCLDWYQSDFYERSPKDNPVCSEEGRRRASRGGSWRHEIKACRCVHRSSIPPSFRYSDYGFRVASDAATEDALTPPPLGERAGVSGTPPDDRRDGGAPTNAEEPPHPSPLPRYRGEGTSDRGASGGSSGDAR